MRTQLMNRTQAAKMLGISMSLFGKLVRRGDLPAIRLGRVYRFDPEQIAEWIRAQASLNKRQA
ncbi:MAG: helix-turn-helix domain-containing protein [Desulfomonilaceae bacterium]